MSDAHLGLQRYEGRYLTHWGWHDGKDVSRYLNVMVTGDHLTAQTESVTYPVEAGFLPIDDPAVERERGEVRPLRAAAEHTFDVVGYPRSYRFVLQDADTARSLVVIRDGEPSEPCPRFVPLPDEVPGRRERGEWFEDPDGHVHFFNTHAPERAAYDAWVNGTLAPGTGNHHTRNTMLDPVNLPLGKLVACLGVTNLDESVSYYRGMGFSIIDQGPDSATLFSRPAREDRYAFPLRLRRGAGPEFSFGFLCENVDGVCASIEERGIDMVSTLDEPAFVDPDGNCLTLCTA